MKPIGRAALEKIHHMRKAFALTFEKLDVFLLRNVADEPLHCALDIALK